VFPSGAVQILDSRVLMVNVQCLKSIVTHDIEPSLIESINLVDPACYGEWMRSCLAEDIKVSACWEAT